jgi:hypothetical protein
MIAAVVVATAVAMQAWGSPDGHVRLLHPSSAPARSQAAVGNYFFARGWRVFWEGDPGLGRVVVSFVLAARPAESHESARESLQIGVSRDAHVVAACRTAGLPADGGRRLPNRTINGVTFAAYTRSDQAMSQGTTTLDYRAVVGGACYAVDRISDTAESDSPPSVTLPQTQAAVLLNATLATLRISGTP